MMMGFWKSVAAVAVCSLALSACANFKAKTPPHLDIPPQPTPAPPPAPSSPPPTQVIVKVPVPVKEACVPRAFPHAPKYPDSDAALRDAGGAADRYQLMAAGRLLRERRLAELEKTVDGCR